MNLERQVERALEIARPQSHERGEAPFFTTFQLKGGKATITSIYLSDSIVYTYNPIQKYKKGREAPVT